MAPPGKGRVVIVTCSVAAIAVIGGWYGADLKMTQEARKDMQKRQDASPQEMLAQLEGARRGLLARKTELEKKIAELEDKRKPVDIDVTSPN